MTKKLQVIVNPISGVGKHNMLDKYLENHLDHKQFDISIEYTRKQGDAENFARSAANEKYDIVVAAGGDGTINETVRGLTGTDTALGILPVGSGNGLAHHLKIPANPISAIGVINKHKIKKIDTVCINNRLFVSIAGVGFDARVARKFAKSKYRGFFSYFSIVSREYPGYKSKSYRLEINGESIETEALFISFANSNQFGYNTQIAPRARIDDGLIDVCIVKKAPVLELPIIAHLLYWGQIDRSKYVNVIQTKELILQQEKNRSINLDGETIKLGRKLHIKINPLSLNILIP